MDISKTAHLLKSEDLIIPESIMRGFGITGVLGKQAHSRLHNCFSSATVESKDKSASDIIEFSLLSETLEAKRFMRNKEVCQFLGISRSTLARWVLQKRFPPPQSLGPNTRGWRVVTVINWEG